MLRDLITSGSRSALNSTVGGVVRRNRVVSTTASDALLGCASVPLTALCVGQRSLYTNKKKDPIPVDAPHGGFSNYVSPREQELRDMLSKSGGILKDQDKLVSQRTGAADDEDEDEVVIGENNDDKPIRFEDLPTADEMSRQMPTLKQLNDELPTSESLRKQFEKDPK